MRNTKSAFTLVELIVVITILAILGTIAFISLQGYSAEARNAKRTSDLSSVTSALTVKITKGMNVMSAITGSDNRNTDILLGGRTATPTLDEYNAGKVNYTALEMKASEFQDPDGDTYRLGASTLAGGVYEVAASIELDGGDSALVTGNFNPRKSVTTLSGSVDNNVFTLSDFSKTGLLKVKDKVLVDAIQAEITKISSDGMKITVNPASALAGTEDEIKLASVESAGLMGDKTGSGFVVNNLDVLPY